MTNEEAARELERIAQVCHTTALSVACVMGAKALREPDGDDYLRGKADGIRECHTRLRALMGDFGGEHGD